MSRAGHLGYDSTTAELIILHADRGSGFSANGDVVVDWEGELVEATFINDPARARAFFKWLDANGIESLVNATVEEGKALWAYVRKANEEAVRKHLVDGGCACVDCMNTRLHDLLNTIDPTPATMADLDNAAFGNILGLHAGVPLRRR